MRRSPLRLPLTALLAATTLALAGCGGSVETSSPPATTTVTEPATPTPTPSDDSPTMTGSPIIAPTSSPAGPTSPGTGLGTPTTSTQPTSGSGSGSSSGSGSGSGSGSPRRCATADLAASVTADEGGGTAGSTYYTIALTNTSTGPCLTRGYGGVSFVAGGQQIGAAATRTGESTTRVVIGPRESAVQQLRVSEAGNYPQARCRPTGVDGLRIYPPDQTASLFTTLRTTGCASKAVKLLQVGPLRAG